MGNSILEMVQETANDLHKAGVLKDQTLRDFDLLCLPAVEEFDAEQIKQIRLDNKASQGVFAAYLNTSKSTVQKWEQCKKKQTGPLLLMLNLVAKKGMDVLA
jgi:putative transcriptional regulator